MSSITIRVPWEPTPQVSPNGRLSTRGRRHHIDASRDTAIQAVKAQVPAAERLAYQPPAHPVMDVLVLLGPGRSRKDLDNIIASAKGVIDGVTRTLGFDDRRLIGLTVAQRRDPAKRGETVITIREATPEERQRAA